MVDVFEPRCKFYGEDLSPIIGYILVVLTVLYLIVGSLCFLEEMEIS